MINTGTQTRQVYTSTLSVDVSLLNQNHGGAISFQSICHIKCH